MNSVRGVLGRSARPVVDLIFFDAGGGHRASANALKTVADQQRRPWYSDGKPARRARTN